MAPRADTQLEAESVATGRAEGEAAPRKGMFRRLKLVHWLGLGIGFVAAVYGAYLVTLPPEIPPAFKLKQALRFLDERKNLMAREIAQSLKEIGYQDPDFAGGANFVLGVATFRDAALLDEETREQRDILAAGELREAAHLSLIPERRPEWAYNLGLCLHRLGATDEAMPLLEEAVKTYVPGRSEGSLLLAESYLCVPTRENAERALALNTALLEDAQLPREKREHGYLQRAQILLALGRRAAAEEALAKVTSTRSGNRGRVVLLAQTCMAEGTPEKYREAIKLLERVALDEGLERTFTSQACYLMGVCYDRLGELDYARTFYERTVERFERSHEALAARLGAADALRKVGRNEESLENYGVVLRSIRRPKSFRNRWISLKRVREVVLEAWNAWTEQGFFAEAIGLAEMMSPAVPRDQSYELVARANQRWAEHLTTEVAQLPSDRQELRQAELQQHWKRCGDAYARLAETRKTMSAHTDALWLSAEDYIKGHDFENAVTQLTQFIHSRNKALLGSALVRRGQALMDLDRLEEALADFEETIAEFPTDPAAFQARYLVGVCQLERNEPELAEKAWRKILDSGELTPDALEWRKSLFSLCKLLYFTADLTQRRGKQARQAGAGVEGRDALSAAYTGFDEAVGRLEEFLERYPNAPESLDARFLLAKALQKRAETPQEKLKVAETENARQEFRRQIITGLERAVREFQHLQADLAARQAAGKLDRAGQAMLRNCYFDVAHCFFDLEHYEDAISAYSSSAGHFQQEAASLTAYVQIANCYDRLNKKAEALSTLAQARLILKQLPDEAFHADPGDLSREDWQGWLDWAMRLHQ